MNLYRPGDFVPQATAYWYIGARMAMMLNVIGITDDGSRASRASTSRIAWYPRVSSIWGTGKKPNTYLSDQALKSAFLPRSGGRRHPEQAGKFVLVLPIEAARWSRHAWTAI